MTKSTVLFATPAVSIRETTTLQDMAYIFDLHLTGAENIAGILATRYPEKLPKEADEALRAGFLRSAIEKAKGSELWVERTERDTYVTLAGKPATQSERHLCLSAEYCLGFTSTEITKMASDQPNLHRLVTPIRKSRQSYASKRMERLLSAIEKARKVSEGRPARAPMRDFDAFIADSIAAWKKKAASCKKAGLPAPEVTDDKLARIKLAIAKILAE